MAEPSASRIPATTTWRYVKAAAAGAVKEGESFHSTEHLHSGWTNCNCRIEVENWTRWPLWEPIVKPMKGEIAYSPAVQILPAQKEVMVGRYARSWMSSEPGTYGTVSWLLRGQDRRVLLMWHDPYGHTFDSNGLGLGVAWDPDGASKKALHDPEDLWNIMTNPVHDSAYDDKLQIGFKRRMYSEDAGVEELKYSEDSLVVLEGAMGTGDPADVKVLVRPKDWDNLAEPIVEKLEKNQL